MLLDTCSSCSLGCYVPNRNEVNGQRARAMLVQAGARWKETGFRRQQGLGCNKVGTARRMGPRLALDTCSSCRLGFWGLGGPPESRGNVAGPVRRERKPYAPKASHPNCSAAARRSQYARSIAQAAGGTKGVLLPLPAICWHLERSAASKCDQLPPPQLRLPGASCGSSQSRNAGLSTTGAGRGSCCCCCCS